MTTLIPKYDLKNGGITPTGAVNRSIREKLAETVNVKDFGATGDGATDDTAALVAAFNYAATNGVPLSFDGSGTYLLDVNNVTPVIPENKKLIVYGNGATIKQRTATTTDGNSNNLIYITSATLGTFNTEVDIRDLNFNAVVQPQNWTGTLGIGSNAMWIKAGVVNIDNCKAQDFFFSTCFGFFNCRYVNVTNCYGIRVGGHTPHDDTTSSSGDALYFAQIYNGCVFNISNCSFTGYPTTPYQGGYPSNLSRDGITFEFTVDTNPAYFANVSNCYFEGYQHVIHSEQHAYMHLNVVNVNAINGYSFMFFAGGLQTAILNNCTFSPNVSGNYNGVAGFSSYDISGGPYTLLADTIEHTPVSDNQIIGTFYDSTFNNMNYSNFAVGGTGNFYNCTFNGIVGGLAGGHYQFFGNDFRIFDGCIFNGTAGSDYKLSFQSRGTSQLDIRNCNFNNCGFYADGSSGGTTVFNEATMIYTQPISNLTMIDSTTQIIRLKNSTFIAANGSNATKLNSSTNLSEVEISNSYVLNATFYTDYAKPATILGSTFEYESTATPTAQGFYGRYSDYVILSACTFISPTSSAITLATPDLRNSCVTKINGTVSALANI